MSSTVSQPETIVFTPADVARVIEEVAWNRGYKAGWVAAALALDRKPPNRLFRRAVGCLFCDGAGKMGVNDGDGLCPVCEGRGKS